MDVNDEAGSLVPTKQLVLRWHRKERREREMSVLQNVLHAFEFHCKLMLEVCGGQHWHSQVAGVGQASQGLFQALPTL